MQIQTQTLLHTGCKINLFLLVGERLPDGYHNLETLFLPLSVPFDTLIINQIEEQSAFGITVECDTQGIDLEKNTLTKAYALFSEATGYTPRLHVALNKGVPHGGGLGGGSANAAGILLYLNEKIQATSLPPLSSGALCTLAKAVGADVPFFLINTPALGTGVGEKLIPTPNPFAGWHIVLVCPDIQIPTAWAFEELDEQRKKIAKKITNCLTKTPCRDISPFLHGTVLKNDFEEIIFEKFPQIYHLCDTLREKGAYTAHVSGTGASVFGLFSNLATAKSAAAVFSERHVYVQSV